jgi:hypothetical protein
MLHSLMLVLGLNKPSSKKVTLPEGLTHLEVISAKAWWH